MNNQELNRRLIRIRGVPYTIQPTYKRLDETLDDIRNHFKRKPMIVALKDVKLNDVLLRGNKRFVVKEITPKTDMKLLSVTDLATLENDLIFGSPTLIVEVE